MSGKLIVIEGTDCSGKETQSNLLKKRLRNEGIRIEHFSYPNYQSPTGKIIGGSYLGKSEIGPCLFPEGPVNVDPKVASLYYAADRKYNIDKINYLLENDVHVLLDRYVYSNMVHQGCKIELDEKRKDMYDFLEQLEFNLLELPKPDISIYLHMPSSVVHDLMKKNRKFLDEPEKNDNYLKLAEKAYLEIANRYHFKVVECVCGKLKTIDEIHEEIYQYVKEIIT